MNREWLARAPLPLLALSAAWGVWQFQMQFTPWFVAALSALAFEAVYVSLALVPTADSRRATVISITAVVVSVVYNTLSSLFHLRPALLDNRTLVMDGALALLHGAPLAIVAYAVADLLLHGRSVAFTATPFVAKPAEPAEMEKIADLHKQIVDVHRSHIASLQEEIVAERSNSTALRNELGQHNSWTAKISEAHSRREGFVYVARADNGSYKIGMAVDVHRRLQEIRTAMPFHLELVLSIATDHRQRLERRLHECFADRRLRGEWFALSESDIDALQTLGESVPSDAIDDVIESLSDLVNMPVMLDIANVRSDELPEIVKLKEVDGLSFAQIGEQLNISRQAAWQRYSAAKKAAKE